MAKPRNNTRDSCPPVFTAEEWQRVVVSVGLSPRQAEVVGLIMQSKTDKEIASKLELAKATVRTYIERCRIQLNAVDRVGIACRMFEAFRRLS